MKKTPIQRFADRDYKNWPGMSLTRQEHDAWIRHRGVYSTDDGLVEIFTAFNTASGKQETSMRFVAKGRVYWREWERRWGDRALARQAKLFAREKSRL